MTDSSSQYCSNVAESFPEWYASDNDFRSREWMERLHSPIIELAQKLLGNAGGMVLDLGCGNGVLLKSIIKAVPRAVPFGIDYDAVRIQHAKLLLPKFADHFCRGNLLAEAESLWRPERKFTVAILMPGHLLSGSPDAVKLFKARLQMQCQHIITYCYQDWILQQGSLEKLSRAAGLLIKPVFANDRVATGILESYKNLNP